jgi:hypothetical protein
MRVKSPIFAIETMNNTPKYRLLFSRILPSAAILLILMFMVHYHVNRQQPDTQSFDTKAQLTPNEFISLFDLNNTHQAKEYIDEAIEIEGVLEKVTFRDNTYSLFINIDQEGKYIICEMQADQNDAVNQIQKGEIVTVKGIFKGILLDAILLNCIIIKETL